MMVYKWKPGFAWKADPQVAGQRFSDLIEENDGMITPAIVVEDAKSKNSPLHEDFEWNNKKAADEWRQHTARMMLAAVVIVHTGGDEPQPQPIRAFVNVRQESGRGYTTTARAVNDDELFEQIISDALKAIDSYRMKLAAFKQYSKLERAFVDFAEALKTVKN